MTDTTPLPDYAIRRSTRARRMRLTVSPLGGVEVVVPQRMALRHVEPFVHQHRDWIAATRQRLAEERARCGEAGEGVPERVELRAIGHSWRVEARPAVRGGVCEAEGVLTVSGGDEAARIAALQRWSGRKARAHLEPWLAAWSERSGLGYQRLTVRGQRSRWGSCSTNGTISLNRKLLFLPPALVDYIVLHELCHTRHPGHSQRFWGLVGELMPDYRERERALRRASRYIPHWAYGT